MHAFLAPRLGGRMTRKEAEAIIESMLSGSRDYERTAHFWENCFQEGFTLQDVNPILRSHTMRGAPEARRGGVWRVRIVGTCLEGRRTLLVLDLQSEGPCALVSIMTDNIGLGGKGRTR